jgi:type III secretory pathway component EscS
MELKDLKKAWSSVSSDKELDETQIREMLGTRTRNLLERIDRNIKIGFVLLFALILLFILDDFVFSPHILNAIGNEITIPSWLLFINAFSYALILTTFVYFVFQYYRAKKSCDINCNLRETLRKIIKILQLYQRLFYLALVTFSVAVAISFISGMLMGMEQSVASEGMQLSEIPFNRLLIVIVIGLIILTLLVGGIFLFMRWGFRRLYGNYIQKLKRTLNELNEVDA